jgi:hypothetical protein
LVCSRTVSSPGSATLSWTPPTQNTDGTSLTNLAGYRIYHGTVSGSIGASTPIQVANPSTTTYILEDLPNGVRYYFGVAAYTTSGAQSSLSNIATKTIASTSTTVGIFDQSRSVTVRPPANPNPPSNLVVDIPVAGVINIPVFTHNGSYRGSAVVGFVDEGTPCLGTKILTYRGLPYHRVPSTSVKWWATKPTNNIIAPCKLTPATTTANVLTVE